MWLKQSTVHVINFGPVLDSGDGKTLETAAGIITSLDAAATGIMLSKNGGALAVREQGANFVPSTYDAHGCFKVSLSAVDTGTLGRLRVIHTEPATYLAVWQDFMVVPAQVWDSLFGADKLDVAVVEQADIDFQALQKASLTAALPSVADILAGDLADDKTFPAGSLADRLRKLFWVLCNRLVITDATGAFVAYKGDGVTPAATGAITDDRTKTERSAPTWP